MRSPNMGTDEYLMLVTDLSFPHTTS